MKSWFDEELAAELRAHVKISEKELLELCRFVWNNPELGMHEAKACAAQVKLLQALDFEVKTPFAGLDTAYLAERGTDGPVFAFAAEYDCLPEIGHACGHNLICTAAVAAGYAAAEYLKKHQLPGRVMVMGTPGEESCGGKVRMLKNGCLDGIDAVMMVHPSYRSTPDTGSTAICRYDISFSGKAAHAAASPELGINALDAVMLLFQGVNAWRQQLPETARIHGIVTKGGAAPNIIPDFASARFFLRSTDDEVLAKMRPRFLDIVRGAALMTGTREEVRDFNIPYRARRPNAAMNRIFESGMIHEGNPLIHPERSGRGSSDFGDFSQAKPGLHAYFGISPVKIAGHSVAFREAAATPYAEKSMFDAAVAMAQVGVQFIAVPEVRETIEKEFKNA